MEGAPVHDARLAKWVQARGYGKGTRRALEAALKGDAAFSGSFEEGSKGNGAAVRVSSVAVLYHDDPAKVLSVAKDSACITHPHPIAETGAIMQALMVAKLLITTSTEWKPKWWLDCLLEQVTGVEGDWFDKLLWIRQNFGRKMTPQDIVAVLGNGVTADEPVPAALDSFARSDGRAEQAFLQALSLGGDTDSIASMTGALTGAWVGEQGLPRSWLERLENLARGRDHVVKLADELVSVRSKSG